MDNGPDGAGTQTYAFTISLRLLDEPSPTALEDFLAGLAHLRPRLTRQDRSALLRLDVIARDRHEAHAYVERLLGSRAGGWLLGWSVVRDAEDGA